MTAQVEDQQEIAKKKEAARKLRQQQLMQYEKEDKYKCPICWCVCVQPVFTPCKHMFCFKCQVSVI